MRKVMVFGVFDGVHEGHRAFLREAKTYGDYLIAVVAQDPVVEILKGRAPRANLAERFEHLKTDDSVDEVVVGDAELGAWEVLGNHRPHVIALGYDQRALKEELETHIEELDWRPELKVMSSYEPSVRHSSLM